MVLLALAGFYIEAFSSSPAPAVVVFRSVKCSKPFLDDLDIEACLACISLSLPLSLFLSRAVHKSHMSSDATSSQRATALKSLAQGGQPAAPAMWCTATPSQQSTSPAAESIIPHPWILHPPPQCLHIHDPWPFISDPLPCKILGLPELDGTVRNTVPDCMAALLSYWWLFPHGVSSRPVWPGLSTDL